MPRAADSTATENLPHQLGGMVFFLAAAAGVVVLSRSTRRHARLGWATAAVVIVYFLSIDMPGLALTSIRGLLQRLCFSAIVTWLSPPTWRSTLIDARARRARRSRQA